MRKTIVAAGVGVAAAVSGLAGAELGGPTLAGAAQTATGAAGWVQDALSGLVDDGTITKQQADAVASALQDARPEHGSAPRHAAGHRDLSGIAAQLGVTEDDLRAALRGGQTIAEIAGDQGVDVQAVIDSVVAAERGHLDDRLAAGGLSRSEADRLLAAVEQRATAFVNGTGQSFHGGRAGHGAEVDRGHEREIDPSDASS